MDVLEKINERYADELTGLFPVHRLIMVLFALPPFLNLLSGNTRGFLLTYATISPKGVFSLENGILWEQSWAFWILLILTTIGAVLATTLAHQAIVSQAKKSSFRSNFLFNIQKSSESIRRALPNSTAMEEALLKKYNSRKKIVLAQLKLSEMLIAVGFISMCFISKWSFEDILVCATLLLFGWLLEKSSYRAYIRLVAPSYLLHGYLTNSIYDLEDGFIP